MEEKQKKRLEWCNQSQKNSTHCYWFWRGDSGHEPRNVGGFCKMERQGKDSRPEPLKKEGGHLGFSLVRVCYTSASRNCKIINLCHSKPLNLQWFVMTMIETNTPESKSECFTVKPVEYYLCSSPQAITQLWRMFCLERLGLACSGLSLMLESRWLNSPALPFLVFSFHLLDEGIYNICFLDLFWDLWCKMELDFHLGPIFKVIFMEKIWVKRKVFKYFNSVMSQKINYSFSNFPWSSIFWALSSGFLSAWVSLNNLDHEENNPRFLKTLRGCLESHSTGLLTDLGYFSHSQIPLP